MNRTAFVLVLLAASTASAQQVDYVGKVHTTQATNMPHRPIGDARYVPLSDLMYDEDLVSFEVLDLATTSITKVSTTRTHMMQFAGYDKRSKSSIAIPPYSQIVKFEPGLAGVFIKQFSLGGPARTWYGEIDVASGAVVRAVNLGKLREDDYVVVLGTDAANDAAWFALVRGIKKPTEVVFRKLDLITYAVTNEITVPLTQRSSHTGYEGHIDVRASNDFSHFAIIDYVEDGMDMDPGNVWVVDNAARTTFTIPAPSTAYGVAWSGDGKYLYLGSSQRGTISRVDLAKQKIDVTANGPKLLHNLVISPSGKSLFVLGTSGRYSTLPLPSLGKRSDKAHAAKLSGAMRELFDGGTVSADGTHIVLREAGPSGVDGTDVLIARFVD